MASHIYTITPEAHIIRAGERIRWAERYRAVGDLRNHALFLAAADRELDAADLLEAAAAAEELAKS